MSIEHHSGGDRARCDRCGLATPRMATTSDEAVEQMLQTAGWHIVHPGMSYCPRCSDMTARTYAQLQRRGMARSAHAR